jgi:ABC-type nitrate/sulfonate/bicarbonate transport system substrate-binding protein
MTILLHRRAFLLAIATGVAAIPAARGRSEPRRVTVALDWTPNTNHIGLYVARGKGFYAEAGLDVEILPYGDTSSGTLISNQIADFGVTSAVGFFAQRAAGADLKAVYAVVQTETGRLVFNAARTDIRSPRDLDGLTYAGFGSDWEKALISALIRHDGGRGEFETVTLGTSAYEALANGAVDFTLEVYTWEGVKAELEGREQRAFRYADYGVPDQHTTFIASSEAYLKANSEASVSFIQTTRRGYEFAGEHPDEAAEILIAANRDILTDPALIHASLKALIDGNYLRSADGIIGHINPEKVEAIGGFLFEAGILRDSDGNTLAERPNFSTYFTNRYLSNG